MSEIGILNIGAGDTKLVFDKDSPADCIRAARVVRDMLRRGYALLIEVDDGKGGKTTTRAIDFREDTCEYIIADFDSAQAAQIDETPEDETPEPSRRRRRVPATSASGVAVARTAGG